MSDLRLVLFIVYKNQRQEPQGSVVAVCSCSRPGPGIEARIFIPENTTEVVSPGQYEKGTE